MKLSHIFENKNLAAVKNTEKGFQKELQDYFDGKESGDFLPTIQNFVKFSGSNKSNTTFGSKPSGKSAVYGGKSEPKTDLVIKVSGKVFNVSLKTGNSYIVSIGNKSNFDLTCAAALEIFEDNFGISEFKENILKHISQITAYIGSNKKDIYSDKELEHKEESWFSDDKLKKIPAKQKDNKQFAVDNKQQAINAIKQQSKDTPDKYSLFLREAESAVKQNIKRLFEDHNNFAKCFFFEIFTGAKKFGGYKQHPNYSSSSPIANTVIDHPDGIFDLDSINSKIVLMAAKHPGPRLQNVPRGNVTTFTKTATPETRNLQNLIDCLEHIDLVLKIGIDKNSLNEFKHVESAVLNMQVLQKLIINSSLLEILLAFNLWFEA